MKTKALISLIWVFVFAYAKRQNFKLLAIMCDCTARVVSDLVGNPEDRFSHDTAHIMLSGRFSCSCIIKRFELHCKTPTLWDTDNDLNISSCLPSDPVPDLYELSRVDRNQAVQPQKMARGLKFGFRK